MKMKNFMLIFIAIFLINSARSQTEPPEIICSGRESFENISYLLDRQIKETTIKNSKELQKNN